MTRSHEVDRLKQIDGAGIGSDQFFADLAAE